MTAPHTRLVKKVASALLAVKPWESVTTRSAPDFAKAALDACHAEEMAEALKAAHTHVQELRDAWARGAISEHDGRGGTRSNRNVDVEITLRALLAKLEGRS